MVAIFELLTLIAAKILPEFIIQLDIRAANQPLRDLIIENELRDLHPVSPYRHSTRRLAFST